MFSKRIISMLVVLSFISQSLVVVDTDSYSSVVVEDSSILEELSGQDGARGGNGIELVWDNSVGFSHPDAIASMGDYLLYHDVMAGCDNENTGCGIELFRSDGTAEGTGPVKDIWPGETSSGLGGITNVNGVAYFRAEDGTNGDELWRSDGTENGTYMVKDIWPGDNSSDPGYFTKLGNEVLFVADDGVHGRELWKSDGTAEGTVLVKDIDVNDEGYDIAGQFTNHQDLLGESSTLFKHGNIIYFKGDNGTSGYELWRSDGTTDGTYLVKEIRAGDIGGIQGHFESFGDHFYFPANDNTGKGTELWRSDGTEEGTVLFKEIYSGWRSSLSSPGRFLAVGDTLFFYAADGTEEGQYDYNLW